MAHTPRHAEALRIAREELSRGIPPAQVDAWLAENTPDYPNLAALQAYVEAGHGPGGQRPLTTAEGVLDALATGGTFGLAPKIAGALGLGEGETYGERVAALRAPTEAFEAERPGLSTAAQIVGGAAVPLPLGPAGGALGAIARPTIRQLAGAGARAGLLGGAISGAGYAEPGQELGGGLFGGVLGAAAGGVLAPLAGLAGRGAVGLARRFGLGSPARAGTELVEEGVRRSTLGRGESAQAAYQAARARLEATPAAERAVTALADVLPEARGTFRGTAQTEAARLAIGGPLEQRAAGAVARLEGGLPGVPAAGLSAGLEAARREIGRAYDLLPAMAPTPEMRALIRTPAIAQAISETARAMRTAGEAAPEIVRQIGRGRWESTSREAPFALWQQVLGTLRDRANSNFVSGNTSAGARWSRLARQYNARMLTDLEQFGPQQAQYARTMRQIDALDEGRQLFRGAISPDAVREAVADYAASPEAVAAFRAGATDALASALEQQAPGLAAQPARKFRSPALAKALDALFPDPGERQAFNDLLDREAERVRTQIASGITGSPTAINLAEMFASGAGARDLFASAGMALGRELGGDFGVRRGVSAASMLGLPGRAEDALAHLIARQYPSIARAQARALPGLFAGQVAGRESRRRRTSLFEFGR